MTTPNELLEIEPLELKFPFELRKQVSCSIQLTNKTENHVAFKIKTTSPKKYCVRPNSGIVLPGSTSDVVVTMQAQKEAPLDFHCKDKFLVQSVIVNEGFNTKDITAQMFSKDSGNLVDEVKLRVAYVAPPQRPSPVPEESDEASVSENGNFNNSEYSDSAMREYSEQKSSYVEVEDDNLEALISRLTEEKNSAIQQNNKLRQELEMVRREVGKQRNGFSLALVIVVAFIGLIMGYFMKKMK
ncbi:hypothetical protein LUZ60_016640 [Juncus effusus]|nr:hypothetical protein LUZ60_016640 [Juncus effusus]